VVRVSVPGFRRGGAHSVSRPNEVGRRLAGVRHGWQSAADFKLPPSKGLIPGIVASDEFDRQAGDRPLPLVWQWNHNPDNKLWSLKDRPGYLRLTTGRTDTNFLAARNTLTQRTIGPECAGATAVDVSHLKDGDFAGLALLQRDYGLVA
jgi:beta-xylosidase